MENKTDERKKKTEKYQFLNTRLEQLAVFQPVQPEGYFVFPALEIKYFWQPPN